MSPVVVVLGQGGLVLGQRLCAVLPGARLHALKSRLAAGAVVDDTFADTAAHLHRLFADKIPIIGVCAAGILIRALAPMLADKQQEPPVLAVAHDGSSVVPLLGGHHGANELARTLAGALGVTAAITTAGDLRFGLALDEPPPHWRAGHPLAAKNIMAALVDGRPVTLKVEAGDAGWIETAHVPFADDAALTIRVTDKAAPVDPHTLVLHPPVLALGVGCARAASAKELEALAFSTLSEAGLSPQAVACVVSVDVKADEPAVHALAARLGVPARFLPAVTLEALTPRLKNPSETVFREVGCHGVAEASALAAAGSDGELIVAKIKSGQATCAVARATGTIDPARVGCARGHLHVVGIGPGAPGWRTPEATAAVTGARHLVGYDLYLDLLGEAAAGKIRHDSPLGEETERVRTALDLAASGESVALICSGDPGIYALASLVFETVERHSRPDWGRIEITV
ncbi:MAG: cobalamin biosynthesis protein, partial [Alphaproteobacteria bacterium]|nr:cobalamin biosynthesis protein [Alphaproteobacteria bacterium]